MNSTNSRLPSTVVWSAHDTYIPLVTNSAYTYNAKHLIEDRGQWTIRRSKFQTCFRKYNCCETQNAKAKKEIWVY